MVNYDDILYKKEISILKQMFQVSVEIDRESLIKQNDLKI